MAALLLVVNCGIGFFELFLGIHLILSSLSFSITTQACNTSPQHNLILHLTPENKTSQKIYSILFLYTMAQQDLVRNLRYAGHHVPPHDTNYYSKCFLGGALACGLTHTAIIPLDVVKMHYLTPHYNKGLISMLKMIMADEGGLYVWRGWLPTLVGYSLEGAFRYGLYEISKDLFSNALGEENSKKYRALVWCAGAASAEVLSTIALCPLEMTRVKIQASRTGTFPTTFIPAITEMIAQKETTRFPFGSIVPMWSRLVPATVTKFFFFEKLVALFYTYVLIHPKDTYSRATQLGVTFASGTIAGVIWAILSHPVDSLLYQVTRVYPSLPPPSPLSLYSLSLSKHIS